MVASAMAFRKTAKALVQHPGIYAPQWSQWRQAMQRREGTKVASTLSLVDQASEILGEKFDPGKYLLTHCFPGGHKVLLGDGSMKRIEDVHEKDIVVTHTGHQRTVTQVMSREVDELLVEFVTDKGIVRCTREHPFRLHPYTSKNAEISEKDKWKEAQNIEEGELLQWMSPASIGGALSESVVVRQKREIPFQGRVYNFSVEFDESYVVIGSENVAGGFCVHNCTIVASVDTEEVPNVKLGSVEEAGQTIIRKFPDYYVTAQTEHFINNNCDACERKVLQKSYRTFIGAESYLEHVQVKELSKGRILDAIARDIGPSTYIDILVANHRKHGELITRIESGELNTLSMGCVVGLCVCSQCGNVAADESQMCTHVSHFKGNHFFDSQGQRRKVAELCGHSSLGDTGGVNFIEASWVAVPAFTGAVMRNIIEPSRMSPKSLKQMQAVLDDPPKQWVSDAGQQKAAALASFEEGETPEVGHSVAQIKGGTHFTTVLYAKEAIPSRGERRVGTSATKSVSSDPIPPATRPTLAATSRLEVLESRLAHLQRLADEFDFGDSGESSGNPVPDEAPTEEDGLQELVDETENEVLKRVKKEIKEKIHPKPVEPSTEENTPSTSDNIIKDGAIRGLKANQRLDSLSAIVAVSKTSHELLDNVFRFREACGRPLSKRLYRAASRAVASHQPFPEACTRALGREPTSEERRTIERLGSLLSLKAAVNAEDA